MVGYSKAWLLAVANLVEECLAETDAHNGISRAYRYFRRHAPPGKMQQLEERIGRWKRRFVRPIDALLASHGGNDSTDTFRRDFQFALVRMIRMVDELFEILEPLGEVTGEGLRRATKLSGKKIKRIQKKVVDSWIVRLLGSLLALYVAVQVKQDRVFRMNPAKSDIIGTLNMDLGDACRCSKNVLLPTIRKFCGTSRMCRIAVLYFVSAALPDVETTDLYKYCAPSKVNDPLDKGSGNTVMHLVVSPDDAVNECTTLWAMAVLLMVGGYVHKRNASGESPWEIAATRNTAVLEYMKQETVMQVAREQMGLVPTTTKRVRMDLSDITEEVDILEADLATTEKTMARVLVEYAALMDLIPV